MKTHVSAGGVLYDPKENKVYLIHKKERDEWLLPKGHIEEGESVEETALREIKEETGYASVKLVPDSLLGKTEFEFELDGEKAFKVVYYYLAEIIDGEFSETKERADEGLGGEWLTLDQAIASVKHDDIKKVLEKAAGIIAAK